MLRLRHFVRNLQVKLLCMFIAGALTARTEEIVLSCSGNGSYVNLGTPAALQIPSNNPFTIEGWMLFNSIDTRDMLYCKNTGHGGSPYTYMLGFADNNLAAYDTSWRGNYPVTRDLDRWYHLAFSFDGTNMHFYLDGELQGSAPFSFTNDEAHNAKIGGYSGTAGDIDGSYSDVRVWDHARSASTIAFLKDYRLIGTEPGLLGYWPLDEGSNGLVYDCSSHTSTGTLVNAAWTTNQSLSLPVSEFILANMFTMADKQTGDTDFTNSNEVDIVDFPVPTGCDSYQFTTGGDPSAIDPNGWVSANDSPDTASFPSPLTNTNIILYAWFTNSINSITLHRAQSEIYYTTNAPVSVARATYPRGLIPGFPVVLEPDQIDNGSTGGETEGLPIPIHSTSLTLISGPDTDATPDKPYVTVSQPGDYEIVMTVTNTAGNRALSAVCQVQVVTTSGNDFIWEGTEDSDWHNPVNWNKKAVPVPGSDVEIGDGDSVLIHDDTAELASITITGGTITFSNWTTRLNAREIVASGGTITHAVCDTDVSETNIHRVYLVCSNLFLGSSAEINVYELGYRGGSGTTVPGQGPGGALNNGGGSYGGRGSLATGAGTGVGGPVYGNAADPVLPGSGGGGSGAYGSSEGRPGAGAVRIEATGTVTVNGIINASCHRNSSALVGQGSGGAVFIQCARFASTNGVIRADGGGRRRNYWSYGGCGGGGRIAIVYNIAEQAIQNQIAKPHLTLSADGGNHTGHGGNGTSEYRAYPGSIYLSDASFFPNPSIPLSGGRIEIPGFNTWPYETLTIDSGLVQFPDDFTLSLSGDLIITGSGGGIIVSNMTANIAGNITDTAEDGYSFITGNSSTLFHIDGDITLNKFGGLMLRAVGTENVNIEFMSDCVLTNSARLYLENLVTDVAWPLPGLTLDIGGKLVVASNSVVYPRIVCSETTNGPLTLLKTGDCSVLSNGMINANYDGYPGGNRSIGQTAGYGPGAGQVRGGGGYGGRGGDYYDGGQGGPTYGDEEIPLMPGSGGGTWVNANGNYGGAGGGVVWLEVRHRLIVDGTISANGEDRNNNYAGGGSGGSVYIRCEFFAGTGLLQAKGGNGHLAKYASGSGGGGRIAVWRRADLDTFTGIASAEQGSALSPDHEGEPGTVFWGLVPPGGAIYRFK